MRRLIQRSLLAIPVLIFGVSVLFGSLAYALPAGPASLYLTPASGSYNIGDTVTVNIYENSGTDTINGVQANLSYNASFLTFSSITTAPTFDVVAQTTGGSGSVLIGEAISYPNSVTGTNLVATVKFTASAAGSAAISFASGSHVVRTPDTVYETLTTTGGTYTVNAPASPPSPTPTPTPSPSPTPSPGPSPSPTPSPSPSPSSSKTPTKTTTPSSPTPSPSPSSSPTANPTANPTPALVIASDPSDVAVSNLTAKSATISWKTSVPTNTILSYGPITGVEYTSISNDLTTDHKVVLASKTIVPGKTYLYVIKGVAGNGASFASNQASFNIPAAAVAKKSGSAAGAIITGAVVAGTLALVGGAFYWVKNGGMKPQWSGFEPAVKPEPTTPGVPASQVVKPAGSTGEIKPGENVIKPGPQPPVPPPTP